MNHLARTSKKGHLNLLFSRCSILGEITSIAGEQVGELNELGLPAIKLSERDEDWMNAISEVKLQAHPTKAVTRCFLNWLALPNSLRRSFVTESHPY